MRHWVLLTKYQMRVVFLDNLHRTPYGQFYANEINIINSDATKVPRSVGDIYQKAKAYVVIATTTKPNGNPVSFATTADSFLRSNRKKNPRGNNNNKNRVNSPQNTPPNNGLYVPNHPASNNCTDGRLYNVCTNGEHEQ